MENKLETITNENIKNLIYTIRGKQVMLDSDVANLYHYGTKNINKAVKRNIERFPNDFCFQLTEREVENYGGRRYFPYVFTEQGIAMLAGVLKNETAVQVSINIMRSFVEMRKFLNINGQIFERLTSVEYKLLEHDKNFNKVFNMLQGKKEDVSKIFFEGQIYDSYSLIIDIIKKANKKITIIDNYIDDSILKMLTKKNKGVEVVILTAEHCRGKPCACPISKFDIQKFNKEYPTLKLAKTNKFHDRFIIIDNKEMYHLGASIKDLGKKCFGINKIEDRNIIDKVLEKM